MAQLIEHAIRNGEGELASNGALTARTGKYTGRTPKDKFIVKDALTEGKVWWGGNNAMTPDTFAHLEKRAEISLPANGFMWSTPVVARTLSTK